MSGKIIPLKKPELAWPAPPSPWILGEVFTRDGVDYELVTAGEIRVGEVERRARTIGQAPCSVFDLLVDAVLLGWLRGGCVGCRDLPQSATS